MKIDQFSASILSELQQSIGKLNVSEAEQLTDAILRACKVFVAGSGRSGLMGRAFAMRLMQAGIQTYVVGETVTPAIEEHDLLIIGSGSGETKSLISMAEKARNVGATIATVTISQDSTIGRLAHIKAHLPGLTKDQSKGNQVSIQPMASLFEQTMLLFYDAIILQVMDRKDMDNLSMYGKHANLE